MTAPIILAIETSCDDTAAAVIDGVGIRSSVISSQMIHEEYGGVVPELASRAHQRMIVPVVERALDRAGTSRSDLDAVAVTSGPGLAGSLMVGVSFAKALSLGLGIPLIEVNHLEGHIYSVFLEDVGPGFPFLCLIVSGGHTQLMLVEAPLRQQTLGRTLDDAAGEAFDKIAKILGLGYPGGPIIDRIASEGDPTYHRFPRSRPGRFDFSFSGLKTSVLYFLNRMADDERESFLEAHLADLAASVQEAIVEALLGVLGEAMRDTDVRYVAIVGGVSANRRLRQRAAELVKMHEGHLFVPPMAYCTDNAAMIAAAARLKYEHGISSPLTLTAAPALSL